MQEILTDLLRDEVKKFAALWLQQNKEKVVEILDGVVRDGIVKVVASSFDSAMTGTFFLFRQQLENEGFLKR